MKINTLAELKRLKVGTKITLIDCKGMDNHKALNVIREIETMQTNALKFKWEEQGTRGKIIRSSWLYFPTSKDFESWEDGFIIKDGMDSKFPVILKYKVE